MTALVVTLALFVYFGVVGYAIVTVTVNARDEVHVLLSPTLGAATIILITMSLNYFGAPVHSFAGALAVILLLASSMVIAWRKAYALPRSLIPIGGILLVALLLTGRPFLDFGFDWVSYFNDDMNLYVSEARRILEHGFLTPPNAHQFVQNRDESWFAYVHYVVFNTRSGVENLLAFVMAVLRFDGYRTYMPLMLALHLALISAGTALTYVQSRHPRVPIAACALLSASALTTLGTEYQLLGQVMGLPLFIACLVLLCTPPADSSFGLFAQKSVLCAIAVAAEAAVYPELVTVLGAAVVLYFAVRLVKKSVTIREVAIWLASVGLASAALLNAHTSTFLNTMYTTLRFGTVAGQSGKSTSHFPYFLVPSGLPDLFGIVPLAAAAPEPWLSGAILLGAVLLVIVVAATSALLTRHELAAFGSAAVLLAAIPLVLRQNDFGLFKLAMYAQPLFIPTMVLWWDRRSMPRPAAPAGA